MTLISDIKHWDLVTFSSKYVVSSKEASTVVALVSVSTVPTSLRQFEVCFVFVLDETVVAVTSPEYSSISDSLLKNIVQYSKWKRKGNDYIL